MFGVFDPNMEFTFYITRHTYSFNKDFLTIAMIKQSVENQTCPEAYSGGALGVKPPPLDQWNLLISGGFQPPLEREKNLSHHWTNSWIRPWTWPSINPGLLKITFEILSFRAKFHISVSFRYLLSRNLFCTFKGTVSGKITLRTKMALLDWQRYPWKLCLKYDLDIKVFCLFKLFISFAVSLRKWLAHFLFIKAKEKIAEKNTESEKRRYLPNFYQIMVSWVPL